MSIEALSQMTYEVHQTIADAKGRVEKRMQEEEQESDENEEVGVLH